MDHALRFDPELLRRYDVAGPRYTSYPTALHFHTDFSAADYRAAAARSKRSGGPLSLYFHIPFCDTVCFYCGCNKVVTKDRSRAAPYLQRVFHEMEMQAALFDTRQIVEQLHWGGGTPTFISHDEMRALMDQTRAHFTLRDDDSGEYSIEIDPREVRGDTLALLRQLGFNRLSLGVQDFEPRVQQAVNRLQTEAETLFALTEARRLGFKSVSIDLIYGLPLQTVTSFARTLDKIIQADPDRLSVFNYAHLPALFKPQRRINTGDLPPAAEKLAILQMSIEKLTAAGYVYIGMDHFAKPNDELAIAQRNGTLYRNFQGYSTRAECDLIAFGTTAIGRVDNTYSQNVKTLDDYYARLDANALPLLRGITLSADDLVRRAVITQLICHFALDMANIERAFNIEFARYFSAELRALTQLCDDGLLTLDAQRITVQPVGRLLIRNICMVFDRYLRDQSTQRYSKAI